MRKSKGFTDFKVRVVKKKLSKGENNTQNKSTAILNPLASFVIIGGGYKKKGSEKNRMMQLN